MAQPKLFHIHKKNATVVPLPSSQKERARQKKSFLKKCGKQLVFPQVSCVSLESSKMIKKRYSLVPLQLSKQPYSVPNS